jgi:hypothetical protein
MVQFDEEDTLFTPDAMREASKRIAAVYDKAGAPENYSGRFFPGPHKFDAEMQEVAFSWFDRHLG